MTIKNQNASVSKFQSAIEKAHSLLDNFEQRIASGQDKYQTGRAIYRFNIELQKELSLLGTMSRKWTVF